MAKIRKIDSIENGLSEVIKILSEDEVEEAIGKSVSFLRKCSDPDQPQQIDHNDSLKLDLACIKKKKAPPLLNSHQYMISRNSDLSDIKSHDDMDSILVKFTVLHGKLVETIIAAQDPESDKGEEISSIEKKEIFESIKLIEDKILKIKLTIDKKN
mgnify:CR=1 FL=1|tara:strand:- start:965 stop:1432 length:468 start_codon:yes stop_codon:yes gene_type:complete